MPIQHSPPARQTRSQARADAVLTPTPRAPLDGTPEVPQLRGKCGRSSTIKGGRKRSKKIKFLFRISTGVPNLAQCNKPVSHQYEQSLLAIMQQMTQIMANLQVASSSQASRTPAFKTPSIKAPECFDRTEPFKIRSFIQSCQLIFHNDLEVFSQDRKKVLYATSFLSGRAAKWSEPYFSNLINKYPNYLLNYWTLFKSQLYRFLGTQMKSEKLKKSCITQE
ncbi:hypothetical protein O181_026600 [Austropuccinia psidii MF-1]|uniref:DUF4939 domain-containing protein n=1 Tax=Austropuccinia psidii MF-1 TaxID=1389203 RepID=A0A9Q3CPK8_9BASI|nr:hypothetical protein [Austropuccinia psidii MF-1]